MIITYKQLGDIIKIIITGGACGFLYERRRRRIMGNNTKKTLIVVDMQNDFIDGALGTKEAAAIVENVKAKIREYADRGMRSSSQGIRIMRTTWRQTRVVISRFRIV